MEKNQYFPKNDSKNIVSKPYVRKNIRVLLSIFHHRIVKKTDFLTEDEKRFVDLLKKSSDLGYKEVEHVLITTQNLLDSNIV